MKNLIYIQIVNIYNRIYYDFSLLLIFNLQFWSLYFSFHDFNPHILENP